MVSITDQLQQMLQEVEKDDLTVGTLLQHFGQRSIGMGLLIFALPNLVPFANLVGVTWVLAPVLMLFSLQLIFNLQQPYFPPTGEKNEN